MEKLMDKEEFSKKFEEEHGKLTLDDF